MSKLIYLAGPIAGLSYGDARHGWRQTFAAMLPGRIEVISPMRGKDILKDVKVLGYPTDNPSYPTDDPVTANLGILKRDFNDVLRCDAVVACFLGAQKVSIGTCVEFGWADALRKPIVMIVESEGNIHDHVFLTWTAAYRVDNIQDAARLATFLLQSGL